MLSKSTEPRLYYVCKQAKKTRKSQAARNQSSKASDYNYYKKILDDWGIEDTHNYLEKTLFPVLNRQTRYY